MRPYLRLLGGARIDVGPEQTPFRGRAAHRRRLALLALLMASPGHRLSRERIVAYLWPARDSESGRKQLSEALHVIRKELGDGVIVAVADDIRLDVDVVGSDLLDFRAFIAAGELETAVRLYHGPFLDGWYVADAREFDEWAEAERAATAAVHVSALEVVAERAEAAGDRVAAAEHWRRLMQLRPGAAPPVLRLARALTDRGDRSAARQVLEEHLRWLQTEELPPEPLTLAALADLRATPAGQPVRSRGVPSEVPSEKPLHMSPSVSPAVPPAPREAVWADRRFIIGIALITMIAGLMAVASMWRSSEVTPGEAELVANRVAVLYFQHDARDDVGYIADALTGKLIDELSAVPDIRVVSRTGVLHYRALSSPPPQDSIARALGARLVVEGRVERLMARTPASDTVRVVVSLVDAITGTLTGPPQVVSHPLDDRSLLALRDEVAAVLGTLLRRQLGGELRLLASRSGTTNPSAQLLLDRAHHLQNTAWALLNQGRGADVAAALRAYDSVDSLLRLTEVRDRRWWEPIVMRGWVARDRARLLPRDSATGALELAVRYADRAMYLSGAEARALELRGTARWQLVVRANGRVPQSMNGTAEAERDLRKALMLDSTRVMAAITLAQLLRIQSRNDAERAEAIVLARSAFDRDPFLAHAEGAISQLYRASLEAGDVSGARTWCDRGRSLAPRDARFLECQLTIMRQSLRNANPDSAWAIVRELERLDPPSRAERSGRAYGPIYQTLVAATVDAMSGRGDSARAVLARALRAVEHDPEMRVDIRHDEVLLRLALGERQEALEALTEYLRHHPAYASTVLTDQAFHQFGLDSARLARALGNLKVRE
jgi:DNA-binding SARP family transcriptional activator/TolB-like protein